MKKIIGILFFIGVAIFITMLVIAFDGDNNDPRNKDAGGDIRNNDIKIDVEKKYNLDFEAFNLVLDSTWMDIKISYSARKYGWNYYFVQPDSGNYLEIQLDESPKIVKTNPFDGLWIDVGTPEKIRVKGIGVIQFVPNHPFY